MLNVIQTRRSIRKFLPKEIDTNMLHCLIESARMAPSGSNTQPWSFIIITDSVRKELLMKADHNQKWMLAAPVFLVCVGDMKCRVTDTEGLNFDEYSRDPELKQVIRDMGIVIDHVLLEAENQGLGACWTAWFEQKAV